MEIQYVVIVGIFFTRVCVFFVEENLEKNRKKCGLVDEGLDDIAEHMYELVHVYLELTNTVKSRQTRMLAHILG